MTTIDENLPEVLYHYTSIKGLIGILQEKNIWAASIFHLNDKEELFYARDMFIKAIQKLKDKIEEEGQPLPAFEGKGAYGLLPNLIETPKSRILGFLINTLNNLTDQAPVFISSFSEKGDILSQWRGYCLNANGFSIGFDYNRLKKRIEKNKLCFLVKCEYDEGKQKQIIGEFVKTKVEPILINSESLTVEDVSVSVFNIFVEILMVLPQFKNSAFSEEREWRIIYHLLKHDKFKFREGKTVVTPYCEIDLKNEKNEVPIESIIIGPTPNKDESYKSILLLMKTEKMNDLVICKSKIPYREI